jgi:hypothetical protein
MNATLITPLEATAEGFTPSEGPGGSIHKVQHYMRVQFHFLGRYCPIQVFFFA